MVGSVLQVSLSRGGVPKTAIPEGDVGALGIRGDVQKNTKYHGGPRQALLWITAEGLERLQAEGFPLYPGALGENITTHGVDRYSIRPGQLWRMGEVEIEITKLRTPCQTLNPYGPGIQKAVFDERAKAGDLSSDKWGLAGFYASVRKAGRIRTGDPVVLLSDTA
jgi:MOSC domain-containing protein YiiM